MDPNALDQSAAAILSGPYGPQAAAATGEKLLSRPSDPVVAPQELRSPVNPAPPEADPDGSPFEGRSPLGLLLLLLAGALVVLGMCPSKKD